MDPAADDDRLTLDPDAMRRLGYRVIDLLVDHFSGLPHGRAVTRADRPALEALLREPLPESPTPVDEVLGRVARDVLTNMVHVDHPRFFAFVPGPSNFVGVMADALASGFNVFERSWLGGSGPAQIELVTIDWLRQLCGMPSGARGLFVSGGSMANLTALAVARRVQLDDRAERATVYCSDQTHYSVFRALGVLGIGQPQLRIIEADGDFRLPLDALKRQVAADRDAGMRPFCVVANLGTTSTGAVDPIGDLAALCRDGGMWLHADGAYGAAAVLCQRGRALLDGISEVDSLALDPHKWLFQPFEIGCVLVRQGHQLRDTFRVTTEYLKDVDRSSEEVNFFEYGIQLTRGFRALKMWMSLKVFGLPAFRSAIERGFELAERAEQLLRHAGTWEITTPAQMAVVTFRCRHDDPQVADAVNDNLVESVIADGFAMLSSTTLRGRNVMRLCTINPRTSEQDLADTIARLGQLADTIIAGLEEN